jgi:TPP-dependent pyruvate/acetoin dehydrogenase alpha subunit
VDGNDVLAVYEATRRAIERARAGRGPTLIEADTMRMRGHAEHDDMKYVPPAMLEQWAPRDPIPRYEKRLLAAHVATQEELEAIVARIDAALQEDLAAAEASSMPDPESGLDGVYADHPVAPPTPLIVVEWEARKDRR